MITFKIAGGKASDAFISKKAASRFKVFDGMVGVFIDYDPYTGAVMLYRKLFKTLDMRALSSGSFRRLDGEKNKKLLAKDFNSSMFYDKYSKGSIELSDDVVLFDRDIKYIPNKDRVHMKSYMEIGKLVHLQDFASPVFKINLAKKNLHVYKNTEKLDITEKLYVIQDATLSMSRFKDKLQAVKAFILDRLVGKEVEVEWIYVSDNVVKRDIYTIDNYEDIYNEAPLFAGTSFNITKILYSDDFLNKKVVIITDGTDGLDADFKSKTKDINIITFSDNEEIKNKLINYGKVFKT